MKRDNYISKIKEFADSGNIFIVKGSYMDEFEKLAANIFGNKFGVSTCNGTSALFLSLFCLSQVSNKKEVILPAYGFHALVSVVCSIGLKPVFCDVDEKTFAMDFDSCEKIINNDTLAIIVLQPWGNIANIDKMLKIKEKYNIYCISDSSHAHETSWNKKSIGSYFDINCASFGVGKPISGGELGVLTTDNPVFRDAALLYSHTNRVPDDFITNNYINIENNVGIKFRPHLFALLLALHDIKSNKRQRLQIRANFNKFQNKIESRTKRIKFQETYQKAERAFHMPLIILEQSVDTSKLLVELEKNGFHSQTHNYTHTLSKSSVLTKFYGQAFREDFPSAEKLVSKNIVHFYASDFIDDKNADLLAEILLKFVVEGIKS